MKVRPKTQDRSRNFLLSDTLEQKFSFIVLLAIMAAISIYNIVYNDAYLHSDSIANIRYVQSVWESKSLFPSYWTGSTGLMLPILVTGIPIYAITKSLLFTHAAVNIISQFLITLSFAYMLKAFDFKRTNIYQACIVLVVSLACASLASLSIIGYTVYSSFFVLAFINLGYINKLRNESVRRFKKAKIALLFAAALFFGLSTPQYFLMVYAPLVASSLYFLIKRTKADSKARIEVTLTLLSSALFAVSFVAYYMSYKVIMPRVGVPGMGSAMMLTDSLSIAENMLHQMNAIFNVYDYMGNSTLFSKQGAFSLLIVFYVMMSIISLICVLKKSWTNNTNNKGIIVYAGTSVLFVYLYQAIGDMSYTARYFAFLPLLMALCLVIAVDRIDKQGLQKAIRYVMTGFFLILFIAFSFCHIRDYNGKKNEVAILHDVAEYLEEQGCNTVLATFWNAGRLTGVTEDQIKSGSIFINCSVYNWLLDKRIFDGKDNEKATAIIFTDDEMQEIAEQDITKTKVILDMAYEKNKIEKYNIYMFHEVPINTFAMPSEIGDTAVNDIGKTMIITGGQYNEEYLYTVNGQGHYNMYGPYINIQNGTYRFKVSYEIQSGDSQDTPGAFEVSENFGETVRVEKNLEREQDAVVIDEVSFNDAQSVEFKVRINQGYVVTLKDLTITRVQ